MTRKTLTLPEFIKHVRSLMERSGLTQLEVAERLGISRPLVTRALNPDNPRPAPDVAIRIAKEIGGEEWTDERIFRRK